ncbi:thiopurine S-methyltransferase-like [Clavelina lepadiformis]|uniref:Thiopurine S-methyltransferase n=1 Tax=Clavelina lepadiformis TaxID=159417 RepID=A0ABP0FZ47_CLALP
MDRDWTTDEWNNWWKNPGERPDDDQMEGEHTEGEHGDDCDYAPTLSEMLVKHKNLLFSQGQSSRMFVTFCGKALELKWLAEQGQIVVGNDCSEFALETYMKEQHIEYETIKQDPFVVFKGKSLPLALYAGNFFDFKPDTAGDKFDCVWDSASFQSTGISDRQRYVETIVSLMKPGAKYLLSITDFKGLEKWKGPPYHITDEIVEETFGRFLKWKVIDQNPWGPYMERIFFLEMK